MRQDVVLLWFDDEGPGWSLSRGEISGMTISPEKERISTHGNDYVAAKKSAIEVARQEGRVVTEFKTHV